MPTRSFKRSNDHFYFFKDFLTDDLVIQDETNNESQRKYLGVCRLPEENSLVYVILIF